jgi:prolyl-tRNA synthetase
MKLSTLFASTLRETPAEAEVVSHQLLLRAGYIRRITSGVYSYLPLLWRTLQKISTIVREEMNATNAQELLMPILQPKELWEASGRWSVYGDELIRLKDRHQRDFCLAPTGEEVITQLAQLEVKSYRQLPVNLYQISNKYRDERRPRFGLLRGREFIMKDAYSFHTSQACLDEEYEVMAQAYTRIFERCGVKTKMVRSDAGAIGGAVSHEFMMLTGNQPDTQQSGENDVFYCEQTGYAANGEKAVSIPQPETVDGTDIFYQYKGATKVETPYTDTIEKLCKTLDCKPHHICKTLIYVVDESKYAVVMIRGDYEVEETKLKNVLSGFGTIQSLRLCSEEELVTTFHTKKGFVGFYDMFCNKTGITANLPELDVKWVFIRDETVRGSFSNFVIANCETNVHYVNANWLGYDDMPHNTYVKDVRTVKAGDLCTEADENGTHHPLHLTRGIEVGNIFQLGTKYSSSMQATFTAEDGTEQPFVMGCYGIGVSRVAAAAVERYHDANGILWPVAIAPYQVIVVPANVKDETQWALANQLYTELKAKLGDEVLLDDRDERAGVKFKDADLMGIPLRITVGKLAGEGKVEAKLRANKEPQILAATDAVNTVTDLLASWDALAWEPATSV